MQRERTKRPLKTRLTRRSWCRSTRALPKWPSSLADTYCAELNKLKAAYECGGSRAVSKAIARLSADNPIGCALLLAALFPEMMREPARMRSLIPGSPKAICARYLRTLSARSQSHRPQSTNLAPVYVRGRAEALEGWGEDGHNFAPMPMLRAGEAGEHSAAGDNGGIGMRVGLVLASCVISGALGAGIDHYWDDLVLLARSKMQTTQTASSPAAEEQNKPAEVLGDRVKCDVRFGELHLPDEEYRSFFDHCMGHARSATAQ